MEKYQSGTIDSIIVARNDTPNGRSLCGGISKALAIHACTRRYKVKNVC